MTVWVVHPVREDLSAAERFGEIKYITEGYVYEDMLDGIELPAAVLAKMFEVTSKFSSIDDYLLIVGDHLQLLQLTAMLAASGPMEGFNVLRFDREANGYYPVHIQPN